MKSAISWLVGVTMLTAAWAVTLVTPTESEIQAPFLVPTTIGEQALGYNFGVRVRDVQRADTVTAGSWSAHGTWVVVNLDAWARQESLGAALNTAELVVGENTYSASERPASFLGAELVAGIPQSGSVAFELAEASGPAQLRLALSSASRLDSVIVLNIDLDTLAIQPDVELEVTRWAT